MSSKVGRIRPRAELSINTLRAKRTNGTNTRFAAPHATRYRPKV